MAPLERERERLNVENKNLIVLMFCIPFLETTKVGRICNVIGIIHL